MTKGHFDELNYWQRLEAEETRLKKEEKKVTYLILVAYLGVVIVALFALL